MDRTLTDKYSVLKHTLKSERKLMIAFSGGVDSSFLLYAAHEALGHNAVAITAVSHVFPKREIAEAEDFCKQYGIRQITFEHDLTSIEGLSDNPPERCYYCKKALMNRMLSIASDEGMFKLCDGTNKDDESGYRPGLEALSELGVKSPLRELGFTKQEIRDLSKVLGLPGWDKPAYACLATRIPYGERLDDTKLSLVEKAEDYLMSLGFKELRVRVHETVIARIEINPNDFKQIMRPDIRLEINQTLKQMGFAYVALDLQGYRSGSMDESLHESSMPSGGVELIYE